MWRGWKGYMRPAPAVAPAGIDPGSMLQNETRRGGTNKGPARERTARANKITRMARPRCFRRFARECSYCSRPFRGNELIANRSPRLRARFALSLPPSLPFARGINSAPDSSSFARARRRKRGITERTTCHPVLAVDRSLGGRGEKPRTCERASVLS